MRILLGDEGDLARSLLEGQIAMAETGRRGVLRVLATGALVVALAGHLGCGKPDGDGGTGEGPAGGSTGSVFAGLEAGPKLSALEHARAVARAHYARALALDKKEKFEKSVKDYTGAIEALTEHVEGAAPELKADLALAHYRRGMAHGENGEHASAADDYSKALELGPGNAQAHYRRGVSFARTGEHERAVGDFDKALELDLKHDPILTQVHYDRGAAYGELGKHDKAIADFTKAAEQKSDDARIYKGRGAAYAAKGQHDEAIADFTKAIGLKAGDAEALYDRGVALAAKDDYGKAIADYTKAIEIRKDDAGFHKSRAEAYTAKGDYDKTIADYTKAIKLEPDNVATRISRAAACTRKGDFAGAVGFYTKTLELWPNSTEAQNNLAWLLSSCPDAAQRDGKRAVALAQRAARLAMRNGPAHLDTLAAAYAEAGRFGDALKAQEGAISLFKERISDHERRLQLYGQLSGRCRDAEQAVGPAEEAVKQSEEKDPARLDALAAAYARAWRFDDATKAQKKAIALLKARKAKKDKEDPRDQEEIDDYAKRLRVYKDRKSRKRAGELAVELADGTIKRSRTRDFLSLDALAAAHAEAARFDDAVKAQKEAVSLLKKLKDIDDYSARLKLYEQKKPYRAR